MEATIKELKAAVKELKEYQEHWEAHLVNLARLPRSSNPEIQAVRNGRIKYAIERVRDIHVQRCELEADLKRKTDKQEDQLWRDVISEPHY